MNAAARIAGAREADKKERLEAGTPGVMGLSALKMAKKQAAALHESKVKEAAGPRLAALQARREKRDQMKRKGREKREDDRKQSVEDEKHELIRAATTLQAAFRGRQMRVYGCARRVVVIGATGLIGAERAHPPTTRAHTRTHAHTIRARASAPRPVARANATPCDAPPAQGPRCAATACCAASRWWA